MLYALFEYIESNYDFPGARLFQYISFRSGLSVILSLIVAMFFGKRIIRFLRRKQIGETVRELGLKGQKEKEGTPTMGGVIIILAILVPTLLLSNLSNIYIQLMIFTVLWMGLIGFVDDYIKVFRKNKQGLKGKFKIMGQIILGLVVSIVMITQKDITVRMDKKLVTEHQMENGDVQPSDENSKYVDVHNYLTNVPFFKGNQLDYSKIIPVSSSAPLNAGLVFIPLVIFIITAVSNASNLTDGLDGLATGVSAIIGATLGIFAYVSGNTIFAEYLNIFYLPESSELVVFAACFVGACIGFLWFNAYPASIFMGDTGSLTIGAIIAGMAIMLRKELLIPILCGIFLVESLSVILQVSYFKYTKRKYGQGRRIFKMSPLHHHYQKSGLHESKIVSRFWVVGVMLAVVAIITLKIR
ncbi:phospho-N-acetylmuramoyl-pentapeptide-transferase [Membranihabitans maritimus]|uniref:phospho-N-acetylmuramoyl-pentapeptide- transferase n=1 Tax=Membranihabitans maritimus TaxID=2904244 RepID=UPI001F02AF35|nr:phospho-N-acetylmuramoyl-pentapeptide-transferase [Membranihabitans maritimus]